MDFSGKLNEIEHHLSEMLREDSDSDDEDTLMNLYANLNLQDDNTGVGVGKVFKNAKSVIS